MSATSARAECPVFTGRRVHRRSAPTTRAHHDAASLVDRSEHADPIGQVDDAFVKTSSIDPPPGEFGTLGGHPLWGTLRR